MIKGRYGNDLAAFGSSFAMTVRHVADDADPRVAERIEPDHFEKEIAATRFQRVFRKKFTTTSAYCPT